MLRPIACLSLILLSLNGCALFEKQEATAPGCPTVAIVQQLSRATAPDHTTVLRGVRDVTCAVEEGQLILEAAVLVEIALPRPVTEAAEQPVTLTLAGVDASGQQILTRAIKRKRLLFEPQDGLSRLGAVKLHSRFAADKGVAKVLVGLAGAEASGR